MINNTPRKKKSLGQQQDSSNMAITGLAAAGVGTGIYKGIQYLKDVTEESNQTIKIERSEITEALFKLPVEETTLQEKVQSKQFSIFGGFSKYSTKK